VFGFSSPLYFEVGQTSHVKSRVAMPVGKPAAWKYIRAPLDTFERENELFSNASANLIIR
jgi:hypothetical protein